MMCIVYTSTPDYTISEGLKNVLVKNYTKATIQLYKREALVSFEDEEGQRKVSSMECGDKVESSPSSITQVVKGHSRFVRPGDLEEANKQRLRSLGLRQAPSPPTTVQKTAPLIHYPV
ncbi:unnamed protein product [Trifolium pratense]|uniref:Uncharacterized protein n=1 Tax=Trifolium pratense TaxID=57577 RepID=A0ACB0L0K8_TRIPR|nr:unnamed protein product [Trifolium pratense]